MDDLQKIIEKQFKQLKSISEKDTILAIGLEETFAFKKEMVLPIQYEHEYHLLTEFLANCLLQGRIRINQCPRELRIKVEEDLFYTYAWRFIETTQDVQYGIELLQLLNEDMRYSVFIGTLSVNNYSYWLEKWISFLQRGRMVFKGDDKFECYFQKQKEANRGLFAYFGL
ncbi:TPA: hypothetical protein ACT2IF_002118 [Streptococcus suis]